MFGGIPIVTSNLLPTHETVLHARSPSRARRRMKLGHKQHYITRPAPQFLLINGTLVCRPEVLAMLRMLHGGAAGAARS